MEFLSFKSKATAKVPETCILSLGQHGGDPTSHLIHYLSKHFPIGFMVSIPGFKSSPVLHDVIFINDGPI